MANCQKSETQESIPCTKCACFDGFDNSFIEGAPMAWCTPEGSNLSRPCMPCENAVNKPCFRPQKQ